ncbi:hypothetical protein SAMN05421780_101550 [Flexibacter flexilis DSM 6793]|uniref:Major capsid protein n=1 Tax=Flexibacter flexilis DSM 6793 TaxID=927664 RepID=A0A1I1DZX5_9BACT|nr:hypothetical protein [Flexibacter flexilis]SFB80367.1 hypothetical protein SAMN05421780_101550 [Flexibacter flexilis DSM 6793]
MQTIIAFLSIIAMMLASAFAQAINKNQRIGAGALFVGVTPYTELFTGEIIKRFDRVHDWLSEIPTANNYVKHNAIHLVDIGADPQVLIDNTTYPISSVYRDDQDVIIALHKYDTQNTKISDDELYTASYDKIGSVLDRHSAVLQDNYGMHGLHSLATNSASASTPIIETSGPVVDGRNRLIWADLVNFKSALDTLKVPLFDRLLVLCNEHVNDLLMDTAAQTFRDRYFQTETGKVLPMLSFKMYENTYNPVYTALNVKKAFGAAAAPSTDRNASTFIVKSRARRALGETAMYYKEAATDPDNRETRVGFRQYGLVLPVKSEGFGAIVSKRA